MVTQNSTHSDNPSIDSPSIATPSAAESQASESISSSIGIESTSVVSTSENRAVGSNEFNQVASDVLQGKKWRNISEQDNGFAWWRRMGLRSKVTIAAIALSLVPALTLGSISALQVSSTVDRQIKSEKQNRALALTRRLQIYMSFRKGEIRDLRARLIFRDPSVLERLGKKEIERRLNEYLTLFKAYDSVAFYDLNGNVIVQSDGPKLPNIASEPYFQIALTSGEPNHTEPKQNSELSEPAIFIGAPVRDFERKIIGVVRLRLPLSALYASVSDVQTDIDDIYVTDRSGNYILTPPDEQELVGQPLEKEFSGLWSTVSGQPLQASETRDTSGQDWLIASSRPVVEQDLFNPQWTGLIKTPVSKAFKVKRQLFLTLILGTTATAIISLLLALYISQRSTKPLLNAAEAVKKMGRGDLETRLDVPEEGDEIVQLGQNINLMGGQLQTFFEQQSLEAQLAQILGDLARARDEEQLPLLLDQVMHEIQRQMNADRVTFQRVEQADGSGSILAEAVLPALPRAHGQTLPSLSADDQEAYKNQQSVVLNQIHQGELDADCLQQFQAWEVQSLISTPIFVNNEFYGLLAIHSCQQERQWQPAESEFLTNIGSRLGLALGGFESYEQARLRAQEEQQAKESLQSELLGFLNSVEGASSGDLTVRAEISAGEIGIVADFFNAIVENLRDVIAEVKQTTAQVNSSVSISGESIGQLANEALNQSSKVKETLASVEEMTQSLKNVANKAQEASQTTQQAELTAQAGGQAMEKTVDSIQQVRETVAETAKKVKRLGESSQQISKVVELINQIALKTNLLAVNAGIEAARAGEEGRGFAVVAEEVGALAAQSASATKEIEQIINSIQAGTSEVVEAMESSTAQVVEGTRSVAEAQNSLSQILSASQQVNEIFQMISKETVDQADTSNLLQQLMNQMAQVSESASEDSETVARLLAETVQVAEKLQTTVSTFKVEQA